MGWANGSYLAGEVWAAVRRYIPKGKKRRNVAQVLIALFEEFDCDTIDEAEQLCEDAGRDFDFETGEVTYYD